MRASAYKSDIKASVYVIKNTFVCLCVIVPLDRSQAFCVFMSVSLCNYSHSSAHSSDSCRFCQVDIQELAINNSARFVWSLELGAPLGRASESHTGGGGKKCRQHKGGKGALGVWALVCTIR